MTENAPPPPPRTSRATPARLAPLLLALACALALGVAGLALLSKRSAIPARTGPRAALEVVRVADDIDPLVNASEPALPGLSVTFPREEPSTRGRSRRANTFAQVALPPGKPRKEVIAALTPWLTTIDLPAGTRFAWAETFDFGDDDHPMPRLRTYVLTGAPAITTADIVDARVIETDGDNAPAVSLKLSPDGAQRFASLTREWQGRRLAIVVDGLVMSAPVVMGVIEGGRVSITTGRSSNAREEAVRLAQSLVP